MACAAVGPPEPVTIVWWMGDSRVGPPDISPSILNVSGKAAANAGDHVEHQKRRRALFWSCLVTLGSHIVWEWSLTVHWGLRDCDHMQSQIILRGGYCSVCFLLAWGTQALQSFGGAGTVVKMLLDRWGTGCLFCSTSWRVLMVILSDSLGDTWLGNLQAFTCDRCHLFLLCTAM